jgi:hypothetical protein
MIWSSDRPTPSMSAYELAMPTAAQPVMSASPEKRIASPRSRTRPSEASKDVPTPTKTAFSAANPIHSRLSALGLEYVRIVEVARGLAVADQVRLRCEARLRLDKPRERPPGRATDPCRSLRRTHKVPPRPRRAHPAHDPCFERWTLLRV